MNSFRKIVEDNKPAYDIVYIEGNKKYLEEKDHKRIKDAILAGWENLKIKVLQSNDKNLKIPTAKVYIGFSQGTRYFKALSARPGLKVAVGGASGKYALLLKNPGDKTSKKDNSYESLKAHFDFTPRMKNTLDRYLKKAL